MRVTFDDEPDTDDDNGPEQTFDGGDGDASDAPRRPDRPRKKISRMESFRGAVGGSTKQMVRPQMMLLCDCIAPTMAVSMACCCSDGAQHRLVLPMPVRGSVRLIQNNVLPCIMVHLVRTCSRHHAEHERVLRCLCRLPPPSFSVLCGHRTDCSLISLAFVLIPIRHTLCSAVSTSSPWSRQLYGQACVDCSSRQVRAVISALERAAMCHKHAVACAVLHAHTTAAC